LITSGSREFLDPRKNLTADDPKTAADFEMATGLFR
jgi:hypothetical protein